MKRTFYLLIAGVLTYLLVAVDSMRIFSIKGTDVLNKAYDFIGNAHYATTGRLSQHTRPISSTSTSRLRSSNIADVVATTKNKGNGNRSVAKKPLVLNIYIHSDVRAYLKMGNGDRKARVCLPQNSVGVDVDGNRKTVTVGTLKRAIEHRFSCLYNKPYTLRFTLPNVVNKQRQFYDDADVTSVIESAFNDLQSVQLYVEPSSTWPLPTIDYLIGMADPAESPSMTMLSFYKFYNISDPSATALELERLWKPFKATGRVYVATEGVNAQMAVPTNVLDQFKIACQTTHIFSELYLNTDHTMLRNEYEASEPFKALHIRVRDQIVSDGFDSALDWNVAGKEMKPLEWHRELQNPNAIILDCRNSYESDVGKFENAIPLNTTFFRESWDVLKEVLEGKPADTPIMTYCTGGIRCVKINAYLEQALGFTNVNRLEGGIISYTRELEAITKAGNEQAEAVVEVDSSLPIHMQRNVVESRFKGVNYVFDERMGARVTKDVLSLCETCGAADDSFVNCRNYNCHIRFIQCSHCRSRYNGCCSMSCRVNLDDYLAVESQTKQQQHIAGSNKVRNHGVLKLKHMRSLSTDSKASVGTNGYVTESAASSSVVVAAAVDTTPPPSRDHASELNDQLDALQDYCEMYSSSSMSSVLLDDLRSETEATISQAARMVSSPLQGRILSMLVTLTNAKSVLELGTFTGFSALCFAEGLSDGGKVTTCDIDANASKIARKYFELSAYSDKIDQRVMPAMDLLTSLRREGKTFDVVFLDADKKRYRSYLLYLLGEDDTGVQQHPCLLNKNALIIVDNTLWKGLVLEHVQTLKPHTPPAALYGNPDRMRALAQCMHEFNECARNHPMLSQVMLPLRDGLSVIRYSG